MRDPGILRYNGKARGTWKFIRELCTGKLRFMVANVFDEDGPTGKVIAEPAYLARFNRDYNGN